MTYTAILWVGNILCRNFIEKYVASRKKLKALEFIYLTIAFWGREGRTAKVFHSKRHNA